MKNTAFNFIILVCVTITLTIINKEILDMDDLLLTSLVEKFTKEQIQEILDFQSKWEWVGFVLLPLIFFIKISIIAAVLDLGCFFFEKKIKYKRLFNIVVKTEFIFLAVIVAKMSWFYFFQSNYTLEDVQYFYPLSLLNIVGYQDIQPWFVYPFQVLNLFEVAYWFILAYLLGKELNETTDKGFSIVASSYGVGLLIWVVGVVFFMLNIS